MTIGVDGSEAVVGNSLTFVAIGPEPHPSFIDFICEAAVGGGAGEVEGALRMPQYPFPHQSATVSNL
jgi:hypothetical protein